MTDTPHNEPKGTYQVLDGTLEIHNDGKGRLDDVFGHNVGRVRLERMSKTSFWGAIYSPNDNSRVSFYFSASLTEDGSPVLEIEWDEQDL